MKIPKGSITWGTVERIIEIAEQNISKAVEGLDENEMKGEEIMNYYKRTIKCIICQKDYGSDLKKDNNMCPICICKIHDRTSRLNSQGEELNREDYI